MNYMGQEGGSLETLYLTRECATNIKNMIKGLLLRAVPRSPAVLGYSLWCLCRNAKTQVITFRNVICVHRTILKSACLRLALGLASDFQVFEPLLCLKQYHPIKH